METFALPDASAASTLDATANADEKEEELPLLFMDGLPSNFQENAQLAAIATFMGDSDDELGDSGETFPDGTSKHHPYPMKEEKKRSRRQKPYARKPSGRPKEGEAKVNTHKKQKEETKELQLFLSMFHVS